MILDRFQPSPRQIRTALDLLTGLAVISVAIAMAGLTWRMAGHAGTGAITVPSHKAAPAVANDIAPALALAPFGKAGSAEGGVATSLPLELKGVIVATPASLSTAFISVSGAAPTPFRVGDMVSTGTLQAIARDRVTINNGGRSETLAFPDPFAQQPAPAASATPGSSPPPPVHGVPPAPPPPPPGSGSATQNTAAMLARLDATPAEGGYRIGNNAPIGLMPGDLLQSINGASIVDQSSAEAAIAAARGRGTAQIQILRGGKQMTLVLPLR